MVLFTYFTFYPFPILFFFSSRRRHTRWNCDWSSDVCSSDLCWQQRAADGVRGARLAPTLEAARRTAARAAITRGARRRGIRIIVPAWIRAVKPRARAVAPAVPGR